MMYPALDRRFAQTYVRRLTAREATHTVHQLQESCDFAGEARTGGSGGRSPGKALRTNPPGR
jgi:hypothetical protein